jgi:anti-sigma regulatory factor (Ser/Thr protein kinase)
VGDAVRLTIPRTRPYYGVARLVVGGLAARLDLSWEDLEDLQVALESVVANDAYAAGGDVTVELAVGAEAMEVLIGPLDGGRLESDLSSEEEAETERVGLRRLLATVVESADVESRDGASWLRLRKPLPRGARA